MFPARIQCILKMRSGA